MANAVYANNMELACKAGAGKTICAMPDVCFTPPENPATPPGVPVPYPNTGFASDTTEGSKTVKISGEEIMLKNKSYFKKSTGDEAGCAAKKGVINSKNTGKVYFVKWSMDVKCEGENVDRHLDLTTNNHASPMANEGAPWSFTDSMGIPPMNPEMEEACKESGTKAAIAKEDLGKKSSVEAGGKFVGSPPGAGDKLMASNAFASRTGNRRVIFAQGIRQGEPSNIPGHTYPSFGRAKEGHAESKIIEELFKSNPKPKGKLYLKVNGRPICCSCQKVIESAEKAGVKVIVCPPDERDECS